MTVELFVFDSTPTVVEAVAGAGAPHKADAVVVDWERSGKKARQRHAISLLGIDTQIGSDTRVDLETVVAASTVPVICRIDAWAAQGPIDILAAMDVGVSEVILPMVRRPEEVEQALAVAAGRVGVGVMIETIDAVWAAREIALLPISRAYIGLMDLALERGTPDIFTPLVDGTLGRVAEACIDVPFGFGGLTLPGCGFPVPTTSLAAEMVRIGAAFTFLRRSFLADAGDDPSAGLGDIRQMLSDLAAPARVPE